MASVARLNQRGFMRGTAQSGGSRYLSMALASRKLMNRLDEFTVTGELDASVVEALNSLIKTMDVGWQTSNSFAPVPGQSPFGRYEQALVVNEVAEPSSLQVLRGKLQGIADRTISGADREATVRDINEFLYDLENRALYKYSEESSEREW